MVSWWSFGSCWKQSRKQPIQLEDGPLIPGSNSDKDEHTSCMFCNVTKENGFKIVFEDSRFVAFEDINPASTHHIQVVPKEHISSVRALGKADVELVQRMAEIGHEVLEARNVPRTHRRLGFHIPPYYSVPHLHMHVQGLPYVTLTKFLKYPVVGGFGKYQKGFSWFSEAGQTARILERGGAVKISPC